jgi:hypothetical protein
MADAERRLTAVALGLTDREFMRLWTLRYMRGDGTAWPGIHFGRLLNAVNVLRGPHPEGLVPYDRRRPL